MTDIMNIKGLSSLIKQNLPKNKIKLSVEIREPKIRNGHMYLNLKDDYGCIQAIIWKSNITPDIRGLVDGDKVNILGNLNFYQNRCSLSFIISKLISIEGRGELIIEYENTFKKYNELGYFNDEKKLQPPHLIQNIIILTSEEGAALQDFYYGLKNGNIKLNIKLVNVIVQGNDCPKTIIDYLENNDINNYDMVVITRGGGSFEDLFGFCKPELIECIYKLKVPVLSAIGHQVDTTLLDHVSDIIAPTPSLAAQFIVDHNKKYLDYLSNLKSEYYNNIKDDILFKINDIDNKKNQIKNMYLECKNNLFYKIKDTINQRINSLNQIRGKYNNNNITIYHNDKQIEKCNDFETIYNNKESFSIIINNKIFVIENYN